jgi:tungstate transport system substrate-binding protein
MKNKVFKSIILLTALTSLITGMAGCKASTAAPLPSQERLRVATTTSLYDTGLWEYLKPIFEEKYRAKLDVMYAGTGIALEYGKRGDVNIITTHSKSHEEQFVAEGYGVERVPFAYNYFLIVGPESDPAGIKDMNPEDAFKKLMEAGSFISRGDDSGTHSKEKAVWEKAGFDYETIQKTEEWYMETGRGMGPTLLMTSEKQAYTLSDIGTFLSYKGKVELMPIISKGNILLNVYSAIAINPERHPKTNTEMANNLINFLTSPEIQKLIGGYGVEEYGIQFFIPCAGAEPK